MTEEIYELAEPVIDGIMDALRKLKVDGLIHFDTKAIGVLLYASQWCQDYIRESKTAMEVGHVP